MQNQTMIIDIKVNDFLAFSNETLFSMIANMHTKKFEQNIYKENGFNILKCAGIFGQNNVGKTCLVRAIESIRNIILGFPADVTNNFFSKKKICKFSISFLYKGKAYRYSVEFDNLERKKQNNFFCLSLESFSELYLDKQGKIKEESVFYRDIKNKQFKFKNNDEIKKIMQISSPTNILIYLIDHTKYEELNECYEILTEFAKKIEIIYWASFPIGNTINLLKNKNDIQSKKIKEKAIEIIKSADLDIDDFHYSENVLHQKNFNNVNRNDVLKPQNLVNYEDMFKLISVHNGKKVQSIFFDSNGTKKLISLSSYIAESLISNKILIIDEIETCLHFKLTRAIISLFNNEMSNGQLIFTSHDTNLLDTQRLFRKDQIWFASRQNNSILLKSLSDFTALQDKIRSETNIAEKYKEGVFGAIPSPDLFSVLLNDN